MSSSSSRRPAKRSMLGLRVAAKRDVGYYEPATVLEASQPKAYANDLPAASNTDKFLLKFDDGTTNWFAERHIIGQGFQAICAASLSVGQLVYCTVGHRETPGRIMHLPLPNSELYGLALEDGTGQTIKRKQEDLRLIKSRKSARITQDKDYHSLALGKVDLYGDMDTTPPPPPQQHHKSNNDHHFFSSGNNRKRAIPAPMDLPAPLPLNNSLFIPSNFNYSQDDQELRYSPDAESEESLEDEEEDEEEEEEDGEKPDEGDVLMDECSAALVLMSLGASASPKQPFDFHDDAGFSSASNSSGYASSWPASSRALEIPGKDGLLMRDSASNSASSDEGIEEEVANAHNNSDPCHLDHDYSTPPLQHPNSQPPRKRRPSNSVVFQCTWPQCQHMQTTRAGVKRHIQHSHLTSVGQSAEDMEFYYNEVEVAGSLELSQCPSTPLTDQTIAASSSFPSFSPFASSSRRHVHHHRDRGDQHTLHPSNLPILPIMNMMTRRQRSSMSQSSQDTPSTSSRLSSAKPINIPRTPKRREWGESTSAPQLDAVSVGSSVGSGGLTKQQLRELRDIKKCRKVYGMENREMWCTQCKWKKACSRFAEN